MSREASTSIGSQPLTGMITQSVIIHERLARWARQLRPRFRGWPIRWSETRSTAALVEAAARSACPILVVDLDGRAARGLEDLDATLRVAPTALSLVLEPEVRPEVMDLAREIGATHVIAGLAIPPEVGALIHRWLPLAGHRAAAEGWTPSTGPEPEPWERPELLLSSERRSDP